MSNVFLYLRHGIEYVLDLQRYDIVLLVVALCAVYTPANWRRLLGLVAVFTAGHALTLTLGALRLVTVSGPFIEALIALTILAASVLGIWQTERGRKLYRSDADPFRLKYALVFGFGLIYGLSPLPERFAAAADGWIGPLLGFNVGLAVGQIVVLLALLLVSFVMVRLARLEEPSWRFVVLGAAAGAAVLLLLERLPLLAL